MKIIFIRHGQTTGDVEDRYGGDYDDHLTQEGVRQAECLAKELKDKNIEKISVSPLARAQETAEILVKEIGCKIETQAIFKERNQNGILTGMIRSEAKQKYPELVEKLKDKFNTIEGAESYEDFKNRITEGFGDLISQNFDCVAVVWHGGPMRVLYRDILKIGEITPGDCCWVEIERYGAEFKITDSKRIQVIV